MNTQKTVDQMEQLKVHGMASIDLLASSLSINNQNHTHLLVCLPKQKYKQGNNKKHNNY